MKTENLDNENTYLFNAEDAKELSTNREFSKIKGLFSRLKTFTKSKSKGEDKENYDQSR